jgi:hypothetical protein
MITTTAATALIEGVLKILQPLGPIELEEYRGQQWASPTFKGTRHELTVVIAEPEAIFDEQVLRQVDIVAGHLLADLAVVDCSRLDDRPGARLRVEALTIADPVEEAMAA